MEPVTARHLLAATARVQAEQRLPSIVAGVVHDGALAWTAGRGVVDDHPPTPDTQYRIGSITKTFVAVLVLRLRDEGRLDLDDPVDQFCPSPSLPGRTVGQLLAQAGGLAAESVTPWWERSPGLAWPDLAERLERPLRHPAGRRFHYSNLGYAVLGRVVENVRGRPWLDSLAQEVLGPLGMRRTTPAPVPPAAQGYAVHPWADLLLPEPAEDAVAMAPAGQLWSTLTDLARWARFWLGDTAGVLHPDTVEEMTRPAMVDEAAPAWSAYALGLQVHRADGQTLVGHGGSMPGFLAGLLVDRAEQTAALVAANTTSAALGPLPVELLRVVREREPRVVDAWRPGPAPDSVLDMLGVWFWGPTGHTLRLCSDGLLALSPLGSSGRPSRFRAEADGRWTGLDGYFAGETLRRCDEGDTVWLEIATFVFTRGPYEPAAPQPGGVAEGGWRSQ